MTEPLHSANFDELAVALPAHISHPLLKQLATRLQSQFFPQDYKRPIVAGWPDIQDDDGQGQDPNRPNNQTMSRHFEAAASDAGASSSATNTSFVPDHEISQGALILETLFQAPIADASVLIAITNESHPRLLLTKRAGHLAAHAGEISFVGGKHETVDGNNVVTALREACEETALPPRQVQVLGQLPVQTSKSGMSVRPIVALIPPDLTLVPEPGEIERIFWADFAVLIEQPLEEYAINYSLSGNNLVLLTPSWVVDGETVWGLTGLILASLLELCFDRKIEWYYRAQA
ncbi:CoA pyrophosphatase [Psychrobacter arenosus]|uniref:NUDIX hydrolase n=1 Tax=Psychrobacter arenosus TaxID=256326 RepID=UPI001D103575|nr:CoA pyrophosphatase [Psychrobacter arenosus]